MAFQSSVQTYQADAVVGEIRFGAPHSADPKIISSTDAANNVIGRAVQVVADDDLGVTADLGSAGVFAGILIHPKSYALIGTASGTLEPTLTLPNETNVEVLTMGTITVELTTGGDIGDEVFYNVNTGELLAQAPGGSAPANHARVPGGFVTRQNIPSAGKAYIKVGAAS